MAALASAARFDVLNVESALLLVDRLHGHVVSGCVRCVVKLKDELETAARARVVKLSCPKWVSETLIAPCSVSLDGVSVTVSEAGCR